jgi:hypothetical protein
MSEYYGLYLDLFESQEALLHCVIFAAYTTLLNKLLHNKLSKSAKHLNSTVTHCRKGIMCWKQGCAPDFRLFPTMGTCSGHALGTCVCFRTSRTSQTCFGLLRSRLRCRRIGSAHSGLRSHGYPIIAQTRSTELRRSSAALPYMLTIVSSCSADSGLTQPPAAAYASPLTHAVCLPCI